MPCTFFFFLNDPATTEIYPLSLHDALPISNGPSGVWPDCPTTTVPDPAGGAPAPPRPPSREGTVGSPGSGAIDRKSTRLNSSHSQISYAVFCLKKKNRPAAMITPSSVVVSS